MNLKNYTSDVPATTTIFRIQALLIEARVNGITMEYDGQGKIVALLFHLMLDHRYSVRLTANVDAVTETLWKDYAVGEPIEEIDDDEKIRGNGRSGNKKKKLSDFREQGERTAWKIQEDWVRVQLSLLLLQKLDFRQVFMAYLWDDKAKVSFFNKIVGTGMLALEGPKK